MKTKQLYHPPTVEPRRLAVGRMCLAASRIVVDSYTQLGTDDEGLAKGDNTWNNDWNNDW